MKQYLDFLRHIKDNGLIKSDRTNTGTISTFGYQMRFNLQEGFPLVTTKKVHMKSIVYELLWFLKGDTNTQYLKDNGVTIWNEWENEDGNLGPIYGAQWRKWNNWPRSIGGIDQIYNVVESLKKDPDSRRHIVSAWNVADLPYMSLPPCHLLFQFYVANNELSCQLYQRSGDAFLGIPFNIASYALLTEMVAQQCGYIAKEFIWTGGDCHIYSNHVDQVNLQLSRKPLPLPKLKLNKADSIFGYKYEDVVIEGYQSHPAIKAKVAV